MTQGICLPSHLKLRSKISIKLVGKWYPDQSLVLITWSLNYTLNYMWYPYRNEEHWNALCAFLNELSIQQLTPLADIEINPSDKSTSDFSSVWEPSLGYLSLVYALVQLCRWDSDHVLGFNIESKWEIKRSQLFPPTSVAAWPYVWQLGREILCSFLILHLLFKNHYCLPWDLGGKVHYPGFRSTSRLFL